MSTLKILLYKNNNKISEWSRVIMGLGSGMKHGIQCCCLLSWVLLFTWWTEGLRFVHLFLVAPSITSYHYLCEKQSSANSWQKTSPLSWSSLSRQLSTWLSSFTLSSSYLCTTKTIRIWDHPLVYTPQLCCCRVDGNILTFWHCCLLVRLGEHPLDSLDPWTTYGPVVTILIIILRLLSFLALPQVFAMRICCWSWHWYEICWWWKKW